MKYLLFVLVGLGVFSLVIFLRKIFDEKCLESVSELLASIAAFIVICFIAYWVGWSVLWLLGTELDLFLAMMPNG